MTNKGWWVSVFVSMKLSGGRSSGRRPRVRRENCLFHKFQQYSRQPPMQQEPSTLRVSRYRVTLFNISSQRSHADSFPTSLQHCTVVGPSEKVSFQLLSELLATDVRWAEVRWKCVPNERSRNIETSLADGRVCPRNEQVAAASRTEWPTWQVRVRSPLSSRKLR